MDTAWPLQVEQRSPENQIEDGLKAVTTNLPEEARVYISFRLQFDPGRARVFALPSAGPSKGYKVNAHGAII